MKILKIILAKIYWIRDLGVTPDMPPEDAKYKKMVNVATLIGILVAIPFLFIDLADDMIWNFVAHASALAIAPFIFVLNKRGNYFGALILLAVLINASQMLLSIFSDRSSLGHYFFFLTAAGVVYGIPKGKVRLLVALIGLSLLCYHLRLVINNLVPALYPLEPAKVEVLNTQIEYAIYFCMIGLAVVGRWATLQSEDLLREEKERSERLLLNILPKAIADRLKHDSGVIADGFSEATVLFADLVGFTEMSSRLEPIQLVKILNRIFSRFDDLAVQYGLEKIKTIGDGYMVTGGLPVEIKNHAELVADMALAMREAVKDFNWGIELDRPLGLRIGINTGTVVAGVIGKNKFSYDLWGDAVNIASRMESHGIAGEIHVSESTYQKLKDSYEFVERGEIDIKGKGMMKTYFLIGRRRGGAGGA